MLLTACGQASDPPASSQAVDVVQAPRTSDDHLAPQAAPADGPASEPAPTPAPAATVQLTPAQVVGRFGLSNVIFDLQASDSDDPKIFEFKAGGRYVFTGGVVIPRVTGRWALEQGGTQLRLTPDRIEDVSGVMLFGAVSENQLLLLNLDGSPVNGRVGIARLSP
ncbi:hypothetical protein CCO03_05100 [Comamonas serinivorans]|uniref:Uncharacterized protein n=2 Tax=Comamonas serinivorans TaxID=1082851 RepID=A0A1Y0EKG3_9BURK|nr:hypothetical protein CCO03_05100 [Comamonas serinivorans]